MLLAPGNTEPAPGSFDFTDWFDLLPLRQKLRFYSATAIGFVAGALLTIHLSGWGLWSLLG